MFTSITLKFSELPEPVVVPADGVTVFVGANNAGKSLVLREIETLATTRGKPATKILHDLDIQWPSDEGIKQDVEVLQKKRPPGIVEEQVYVGRFRPGGTLESATINLQGLLTTVRDRQDKNWLISQFLRFFLIRLDGRTRFDLTNDRETGDLLALPQNILAHLFSNDELRKEVREIIYDAFGLYFVIDPLAGGTLRIRLSSSEPTHDEQSLNAAARSFHKDALYIKESSDGVQAFVGIVITVMSGEFRAVLIDEPEAFLHPPLARRLGFQLTKLISKKGGSLFASTHSPDFLIGCIQASNDVRVVRLEYSNGKSKGQIVDSSILSNFFKAPLMRSANVISALFHDGVVITESDNDRAFYSEIYYRLAEQEKGYPSILFVNAQNKQTIRDIMGPLRAFGVPSAAIVDIDILKDGGSTWIGWLKAAQIPSPLHNGFGVHRGDLAKRFSDLRIDMKVQGGVDGLPPDDMQAATSYLIR